MKRALVVLAALLVAGVWYALVDRCAVDGEAAAGGAASSLAATAQPWLERIGSAESLAAPTGSARAEISVTAPPRTEPLTIRGIVHDQLDAPIEHFGLRGVRRDANNAFAEERTWPAEFHPGGEFTLSDLEPYVWEIAPVAAGFELERSQRFARSNERPVKFRMLCKVRVTGIVLDSGGAPVAQAQIHDSHWRLPRGPILATTNESGVFQLELDPGSHRLLAAHDLRGASEPQTIELAPLQRPVQLEFRLALGCQLRVRFDPSWRDAGIMVQRQGVISDSQFLAKAVGGVASVCGLAPGWHRVTVARHPDSSAIHVAAVEFVQHDQVVELNFEVAAPKLVTLHLRAPTEDFDLRNFRLNYELLPTLPSLTWREGKRDRGGEWRKVGSLPEPSSDWTACAPGSYVAMPRRRGNPTAPVRLEVPNAVEFELVLPERDRQSPAGSR